MILEIEKASIDGSAGHNKNSIDIFVPPEIVYCLIWRKKIKISLEGQLISDGCT